MRLLAISALLAGFLSSSGCADYGRAGVHKVVFPQSAPLDAAGAQEKLTQIVRDALAGRGFDEMAGTPHIWRKRGVTVQIYPDNQGELILKVRAFGSKRDIRTSERTEQELLTILKQHAELSISPIPSPSPPADSPRPDRKAGEPKK